MVAMEVPLFDTLTPEELDLIEKFMAVRSVERGATIFVQGDHGTSVCFVIEGELDVIKRDSTGQEVCIAALTKGQSVGEMAIIDGFTRSANIRARTKGSLIILKRKDFDQIVSQHPQIGIKMLKGLARMLSAKLRETSDTYSKTIMP